MFVYIKIRKEILLANCCAAFGLKANTYSLIKFIKLT